MYTKETVQEMPEFDPLAQELVEHLLPHVNDREQLELLTWLHEYGTEIHPDYRKDLYVKLSYGLIRRVGQEAYNERQHALMRDYEAWVLNPSPETKYELKKQRSRLYNNSIYRFQRYGESVRVNNALLSIASMAQPRQTPDLMIKNIIEATMVDEMAAAEDQRLYRLTWPYIGSAQFQEEMANYQKQRRLIHTPQRFELLVFCIREFQRIATSPANLLHKA